MSEKEEILQPLNKNFKELYSSCKIGQLFNIFRGKGLCKDDLSDEGNDCILYGQLYTEYLYNIEKITYKTNKEIVNPVLSKKGDIIMPGSGESKYDISNSAVVPYNGIIYGGDLIILRSKKEIDSLYFSYFITNKLKKQIYKISQGVSIIHLPIDDLSKIEITYPSIDLQKKLSRFLFLLDKKMDIIKRQIGILKKYKKGFIEIFINSPFQKSSIELYKIVKYSQSTILTGNVIEGNKYLVYDASGNSFMLSDTYTTKEKSIAIIKYGSSCGRTFLTSGEHTVLGTMGEMIPIDEKLLKYIYSYTTTTYFKKIINKYVEIGTTPNLYFSDYGNAIIPIFSDSEIILFNNIFDKMNSKIKSYEDKLSIIKKIKKDMLKNLFI